MILKKQTKKQLFIIPYLLSTIYYLLFLMGCVTTSPYMPPTTIDGITGIYHRMERGQTLWRISKIYAVELEELVRINRIKNVRNIETGQLIFIPQVRDTSMKTNFVELEDFIWPLRGTVISYFGQSYNNMVNKGINIRAPYGSSVIASRSGKISFYAERLGGWGKTVIIDHGDGFLTVYSRVCDVFVSAGDSVSQGKRIAKVGNDGKDKNSYLHFEIRKGHIPQNPYYYLP